MRTLVALLWFLGLLAAVGCGGGGSDGSGGGPIGAGDLDFDPTTAAASSNPKAITGVLFGMADTQIEWSNAATGASGSGASRIDEVTDWLLGTPVVIHVHRWWAVVPLVAGPNPVTVTATDAEGRRVVRTATVTYTPKPPAVTIVPPSWDAVTSPLALTGTAASPVGVASVAWTNESTSQSGLAMGTSSWQAQIPLGSGSNLIRIRATDLEGRVGTATLTQDWPAKAPAPTVTVTSPFTLTGTYTSYSASLLFQGTASSPAGLSMVLIGTPGSVMLQPYDGEKSVSWGTGVVLQPGSNLLSVSATDVSGGSTSATVEVIYQP